MLCRSAGIGRQAGLRSQCVITCGFKSHLLHQKVAKAAFLFLIKRLKIELLSKFSDIICLVFYRSFSISSIV